MADSESNQDNTNESTPSRASGDGERLYSKSEVEAILRDRTKGVGAIKESLATKEREAADAQLRVEFLRDAVKRGLDIEVVDELFDSYRAKTADDRPAWFDKMTAAFKAPATSQTTTVSKPPVNEPAKAAVNSSDKGSPNQAPRDIDSFSNPNDITKADIERLESIHGVDKARAMLTERVTKWLSNVRIKVV